MAIIFLTHNHFSIQAKNQVVYISLTTHYYFAVIPGLVWQPQDDFKKSFKISERLV